MSSILKVKNDKGEWIEVLALKGDPGVHYGTEGPAATDTVWIDPNGDASEVPAGKSAYESAYELGFSGTEAEWINSLHGASIHNITTSPEAYTNTVNGFTPSYRIALNTVKTQSKINNVMVGGSILCSSYVYPIGYVDSTYAYCGPRVSIKGETGAIGPQGPTGTSGATMFTYGLDDLIAGESELESGKLYFVYE